MSLGGAVAATVFGARVVRRIPIQVSQIPELVSLDQLATADTPDAASRHQRRQHQPPLAMRTPVPRTIQQPATRPACERGTAPGRHVRNTRATSRGHTPCTGTSARRACFGQPRSRQPGGAARTSRTSGSDSRRTPNSRSPASDYGSISFFTPSGRGKNIAGCPPLRSLKTGLTMRFLIACWGH
jgi:hypothetical protein